MSKRAISIIGAKSWHSFFLRVLYLELKLLSSVSFLKFKSGFLSMHFHVTPKSLKKLPLRVNGSFVSKKTLSATSNKQLHFSHFTTLPATILTRLRRRAHGKNNIFFDEKLSMSSGWHELPTTNCKAKIRLLTRAPFVYLRNSIMSYLSKSLHSPMLLDFIAALMRMTVMFIRAFCAKISVT